MEELPSEIFYKIITDININDTISVSMTNRYILSLYNDKFWEQYIINKIGHMHDYLKTLKKYTWKQLAIKYLLDYKFIEFENEITGKTRSIKILSKMNFRDIFRLTSDTKSNSCFGVNSKTEFNYSTYTISFYPDKKYIANCRVEGSFFDIDHIPIKNFVSSSCSYESLFTDIKDINYNYDTRYITLLFY